MTAEAQVDLDGGVEARPTRPGHGLRTVRTILRYVLLTFAALVILFPLYITVVNSLLPVSKIAGRPPTFFPTDPQWGNFADAWSQGSLGQAITVSMVMSFLIVAGQVLTSLFAGYAFAFLEFPFKKVVFILFLATMMIPFEVIFVSNRQIMSDLPVFGINLYDTYAALALPFLATGFGAFLLRQAFLTVPNDLRDAARIDGFGHLRFLFRIALPLVRPTVAALVVFSFLGAWAQYLWPLVITGSDHETIQIALANLKNRNISTVNVTFAATVIATLPLVVLLIVFQKQLVRGLTAGAVKG